MTCLNTNGKPIAKLRFNPHLLGSNAHSLWKENKIQHDLGFSSHILCSSEMGLNPFTQQLKEETKVQAGEV